MRKQHHFLILILAALCLVFVLSPVASASIVEETYIPLPEPSLEGLGYVSISADPPLGFEGVLCVDFQRQGSSQTDTIQISGLDYYAGGAWLKEGTYLVKDIRWISKIANLCAAGWGQCPQTPGLRPERNMPYRPRSCLFPGAVRAAFSASCRCLRTSFSFCFTACSA